MLPLKGTALLAVVSTICSLGFSLVGFDNGLMGGFGQFKSLLLVSLTNLFLLVNGPQFHASFDNPSLTMIGVFVAIYESLSSCCYTPL
jgi:hypothetical protein